ncbi:MAG: hypothetical protein ABJZ55_03585 [Fuerstiella sp.]
MDNRIRKAIIVKSHENRNDWIQTSMTEARESNQRLDVQTLTGT